MKVLGMANIENLGTNHKKGPEALFHGQKTLNTSSNRLRKNKSSGNEETGAQLKCVILDKSMGITTTQFFPMKWG